MRVEVLLFAQLRESLGTDHRIVEAREGQTAQEVAMMVLEESGNPDIAAVPLSFAVNERLVPADHTLREGDRLALLTPVSGG